MAQLQIPFSDLTELIEIQKDEAVDALTMLGFPTEEMEDGRLNVEVTPNRPDCLCVEGLARALRSFKTGQPADYQVMQGKVEIEIDRSVAAVRPCFAGAVVRGLTFTDSFLRSLMQVQEKLHETLGRKRRKVAIGIHDLDKVTPPFRYFACGRGEVSFVPLDKQARMTPQRILEEHEKGKAYAHLVGDLCPMIEDRNHEILSFPPIINGDLTRITAGTANVFIDCTGTSQEAVRQTVNILVAMLGDRGGKIEMITINGKPFQLLSEARWPLPVNESARLLGIELSKEQVAFNLSKMGYRIDGNFAYSPGYRSDVINEVDLIEDIAIAHGFNNFEPSLPKISTIGHARPESLYHEVLVGLGFDEVLTWTLSNPQLDEKAKTAGSQAVEMKNPMTSEYSQFRRSIIPNHLSILGESKDERLPIKIYEIGPVAVPAREERLAISIMHAKASFSEIKGVLLSLAKESGAAATLENDETPLFIKGRGAALYLDGKFAGTFGEVSPGVLSAFRIEQPVCIAELVL